MSGESSGRGCGWLNLEGYHNLLLKGQSLSLYFSEAETLGCIVVSCLRQMLALSIHRSSLVHVFICLSYSHLFDLQK